MTSRTPYPSAPNRLWIAGTVVLTGRPGEQPGVFMVILDAGTREALSWGFLERGSSEAGVRVLEQATMARFREGHPPGVLHLRVHGRDMRLGPRFVERSEGLGFVVEVFPRRPYDPLFNSFWGRLVADYPSIQRAVSLRTLVRDLDEALKDYNARRPHSSLSYLTPKAYAQVQWEGRSGGRGLGWERISVTVQCGGTGCSTLGRVYPLGREPYGGLELQEPGWACSTADPPLWTFVCPQCMSKPVVVTSRWGTKGAFRLPIRCGNPIHEGADRIARYVWLDHRRPSSTFGLPGGWWGVPGDAAGASEILFVCRGCVNAMVERERRGSRPAVAGPIVHQPDR